MKEKVLLIFLLKMPNAAIEAPRSIPPILRIFVDPQVGHLGTLLFSSNIEAPCANAALIFIFSLASISSLCSKRYGSNSGEGFIYFSMNSSFLFGSTENLQSRYSSGTGYTVLLQQSHIFSSDFSIKYTILPHFLQ